MADPAELTPAGTLNLTINRGSAVRALPMRQASWVTVQAVAAVCLTTLWVTHPELALCLAMAVGVLAINLRRFWTLPIVASVVAIAGMSFQALELPAIIGAGAAVGAIAAWLVPEPTDWVDHLHGALAGLTGSSLGLWAATGLLPASLPPFLTFGLTAAVVALVGSQALVPLALRFDHPALPSKRQVRKALQEAYQPPVFKAFDLYTACAKQAPDAGTRRGMIEVATWVFRLQVTRQTLENELNAIDPTEIQERIDSCTTDNSDTFTRERKQATADHLRRLLDHRKAIAVEWRRNLALVDYALAFLEEARAGLTVAREMPGEQFPNRLPEVLHRLRNASEEGDARRRTVREMEKMTV